MQRQFAVPSRRTAGVSRGQGLRIMDAKTKTLTGIQAFVGITAVAGGVGLAAAPDGHLLAADPAVLTNTPFSDFLVPGLLLATFVGVGGLLAAAMTWRKWRHAGAAGLGYAAGLLSFEVVEYLLLGWQPLQAFEAILALAMFALVLSSSPTISTSRRERTESSVCATEL